VRRRYISYRVITVCQFIAFRHSILLTCMPTRCRYLPVKGRCRSLVTWAHPLPQYPLILPPWLPRRRPTNTRRYDDSVRCHALAVTLQGRQGVSPSPLQHPFTTTGSWRGLLSRYNRSSACMYKKTTFLMSNMRWCFKDKMLYYRKEYGSDVLSREIKTDE